MAEKLVNKAGLEEFASKIKEKMVFVDTSSQSSIPQSITDIFYPVGSIYQTENTAFDPNTTWGGTWVKIEGQFLLGSSTSHIVGTTGGEETHILTIDEMPSHNHDFKVNCQHADGEIVNPPAEALQSGLQQGGRRRYADTTYTKGNGQAHNNMPPYYTVNIWKRTA